MRKIFLYGIGSAREQYRVVQYSYIYGEDTTVNRIKFEAEYMRMRNPSIQHVFMIDDRWGLGREYHEAVKQNTVESNAVFKDTLEREGLQVF